MIWDKNRRKIKELERGLERLEHMINMTGRNLVREEARINRTVALLLQVLPKSVLKKKMKKNEYLDEDDVGMSVKTFLIERIDP